MDPAKVSTVMEWASPASIKDTQDFFVIANFYRQFTQDYSQVVSSLTALAKKGIKFA